MATGKTTTRGFTCPCIRCGDRTTVSVSLSDLDEFYCSGCEETFGRADVEALFRTWGPALAWLDKAPVAADDK